MAGLKSIWHGEEAFRQECYVFAIGLPLAFCVTDNLFYSAILIASLLIVLLTEVLNTAIEAAIDRIGPEQHELSRIAKDLGSLAVLISCGIAGVLWIAAFVSG
ncbi:MAG: diacylglycerol kinase [Cognatishimia sp.]|uniref:diacylglycerol kinase n=1 Tax=Cognatishimia sp. TaxID=2211648 RepID=UPI003B8BD44D